MEIDYETLLDLAGTDGHNLHFNNCSIAIRACYERLQWQEPVWIDKIDPFDFRRYGCVIIPTSIHGRATILR